MKFFLSVRLTLVLGAPKNRLNETVLLSTYNMLLMRNKKIDFFLIKVMAIAIHITVTDQLLK